MTGITFESALGQRTDAMIDACTRCGKCVEACPTAAPAGLAQANPIEVIGGILDILRGGGGIEAARTWAKACTFSGECIKACAYGINPRFLLAMTRVAMAKGARDLPVRRREGVEGFRKLARDVHVLPRLQLTAAQLARLGQGEQGSAVPDSAELPDFDCDNLSNERLAMRPRTSVSPARMCTVPQQWLGPPRTR